MGFLGSSADPLDFQSTLISISLDSWVTLQLGSRRDQTDSRASRVHSTPVASPTGDAHPSETAAHRSWKASRVRG